MNQKPLSFISHYIFSHYKETCWLFAMETDVVDKDSHSWSVRLIIALISAVRSCVILFLSARTQCAHLIVFSSACVDACVGLTCPKCKHTILFLTSAMATSAVLPGQDIVCRICCKRLCSIVETQHQFINRYPT